MTTYENAETALAVLCGKIMTKGKQVGSRAGGTFEILHEQTVLWSPWQREILIPERKADIVAQIAETLWVLSGSNDAEWLSAYLPRALDFSDDGKTWRAGYGPRIRAWNRPTSMAEVDQLANVVAELSANPSSRRAVISLWDPLVDYSDSKDVPCNNWLHFLIRGGELHLSVVIRSNDLFWGWSGVNQFEWSALQELVASILGVEVGPLVFTASSLHLYERHWAKAKVIGTNYTPIDAEDSPRANVKSLASLDEQLRLCMSFEQRLREGLSVTTRNIADPMLASWMKVLAWHWTKDEQWLDEIQGTRLWMAAQMRPKVKQSAAQKFAEHAAALHAEKHAVYGDSWKKRGEFVSIQANIARKIDRLGKAGAGDDELDTTTDLLVYLVKYLHWLQGIQTDGDAGAANVADELKARAGKHEATANPKGHEEWLREYFEKLLHTERQDLRTDLVEAMVRRAFQLALYRYVEQQGRLAELDAALQQAPTGEGAAHAARNATRSWNPERDVVQS